MKINEIKSGILSITKYSELKEIIDVAIFKRNQINMEHKNNFNIGDKVKFSANGNIVEGTVKKINRKYIQVKPYERFGHYTWNVIPA